MNQMFEEDITTSLQKKKRSIILKEPLVKIIKIIILYYISILLSFIGIR